MLHLLHVGKQKILAFTLVEMLTVITIVALLTVAAIPGYQNFVRNNQAVVLATKLANSFRLAKAEAIKRGKAVTVCPITSTFDPDGSFNTASEEYPCQDATTWDAWKVFEDPDFNGIEADHGTSWPIIKYYGKTKNGTINSNISGAIIFDPLGFANVDTTGTISNWNLETGSADTNWSWTYDAGQNHGNIIRYFHIAPPGCSGLNARVLSVQQTGIIAIERADCYGY